MSNTKVTVSIVTYNSKNVVEKCIVSIINTISNMDAEIIVVDNSSDDGCAEIVRSKFPKIKLIVNTENVGFGKAHNQSYRISHGKYFLVLNPDTIIFPNAINRMVDFMEKHLDSGVVGCKMFWDNDKNFMFPDMRIHSLKTALIHFTSFCRYFPNSFISRWYWSSTYIMWNTKVPIPVDGITGGIMLFRKEAFESVGGFDENFFLFFEEHDLLKRIKKKGWKIYYLPDAEIQHYFEESVRNSALDISSVYFKSALYYYRKHYKIFGYVFIKLLVKLNSLLLKKYITHEKNKYTEIHPINDMLIIKWPISEHAKKYIVEISYSSTFADRGGMYIEGNTLYMKSSILNRLPNKTGFLRIIPVYDNDTIGKEIKVIKICAT